LSVRGFSENFSNKRQFRENRLSVPWILLKCLENLLPNFPLFLTGLGKF
jgi:hypothetical protein